MKRLVIVLILLFFSVPAWAENAYMLVPCRQHLPDGPVVMDNLHIPPGSTYALLAYRPATAVLSPFGWNSEGSCSIEVYGLPYGPHKPGYMPAYRQLHPSKYVPYYAVLDALPRHHLRWASYRGRDNLRHRLHAVYHQPPNRAARGFAHPMGGHGPQQVPLRDLPQEFSAEGIPLS